MQEHIDVFINKYGLFVISDRLELINGNVVEVPKDAIGLAIRCSKGETTVGRYILIDEKFVPMY